MATKPATMEYLADQLRTLPEIRTQRMFGEYALYCQEKVVGFVSDDEVYLKITPPGKEFVGDRYEEGEVYPGSKPYMHIPGDLLEDAKYISELVLITADALPKPKPKVKKKGK